MAVNEPDQPRILHITSASDFNRNHFHEAWLRAMHGPDPLALVFVPWWHEPEPTTLDVTGPGVTVWNEDDVVQHPPLPYGHVPRALVPKAEIEKRRRGYRP